MKAILIFLLLSFSINSYCLWESNLPNSELHKNGDFRVAFDNSHSHNKDSLITKTKKKNGIYIEVLGKEIFYSIGYEFQSITGKNAFGWGIGTSFLRTNVLGSIQYNQFSLSPFVFYEYGKRYGFRLGVNFNGKINPIMYSNKLNDVIPPDKPAYYNLIPSFSSGLFYRTQNKKLQFTVNAYLLAYYSRVEKFSGDSWRGPESDFSPLWFGLTIKYNLK